MYTSRLTLARSSSDRRAARVLPSFSNSFHCRASAPTVQPLSLSLIATCSGESELIARLFIILRISRDDEPTGERAYILRETFFIPRHTFLRSRREKGVKTKIPYGTFHAFLVPSFRAAKNSTLLFFETNRKYRPTLYCRKYSFDINPRPSLYYRLENLKQGDATSNDRGGKNTTSPEKRRVAYRRRLLQRRPVLHSIAFSILHRQLMPCGPTLNCRIIR